MTNGMAIYPKPPQFLPRSGPLSKTSGTFDAQTSFKATLVGADDKQKGSANLLMAMKDLVQAVQAFGDQLKNTDLPANVKNDFQQWLGKLQKMTEEAVKAPTSYALMSGKGLYELKQALTEWGFAIKESGEVNPSIKQADWENLLEKFEALLENFFWLPINGNNPPLMMAFGTPISSDAEDVTNGFTRNMTYRILAKPIATVSSANVPDGQRLKAAINVSFDRSLHVLRNGQNGTEAKETYRLLSHDPSEQALWFSGPMNEVHQWAVHTNGKPPAIGTQIIDAVKALMAKGMLKPLPQGGLQLSIQLKPEHLGTINLVLTEKDGGLTAVLTAHNEVTKDLIESQLSQLKQSLATLGIQIQKVDVLNAYALPSNAYTSNGYPGEHPGSGRNHQEYKNQEQNQDSEDTKPFDDWLTERGIRL